MVGDGPSCRALSKGTTTSGSVDSFSWFNTHDVFYIAAAGAAEAEKLLMSGWTTIRDIGGPAMGLHRAVEDGRIRGPRIYGSGPVIGQTSGHGDFRELNDPHPNMIDYTHPFYPVSYTHLTLPTICSV